MKTILRSFLLIIAILSLNTIEVKSQTFNWAKSFNSSVNVTSYGIASDAAGNSYITGYFEGTATFGAYQITSYGVCDIFIAKYDPNGNCVWVKQAGGTSDDYGKGIAVDASGNIYVTGAFYGTSTFGRIQLTSYGEDGNPDIFIAKYDPSGNCIWARQAGGNNFDYGFGIAVDAHGNSFITGYFCDTASFGGIQLISHGLKDIFIAKYDANGNCLWAKESGGTENDIGYGIAADEDGNSFITGGFRNALTFDAIRLISYGSDDVFIAKYDPNGNCLWAKQAGDTCGDIGYSIAVDGNGSSYITGEFQWTGLFGTHSISSNGDFDIFTAKYDPDGNCLWAKNMGGETEDRGRHISVDAIGDSYVTGQINTKGDNDIFITEYDPYGRNLWFQQAGDAGNDGGIGISSQANGDCYVTGTFGGITNFGSTQLSGGGGFNTKISSHNLNITAPIGNETWMFGTPHTITWNSNDDGYIKIEMTLYGTSWFNLADSIKASTGSYTFTVPGNGYYTSSIRLTSLSYNNVSACPNYFNTITTGALTDLRVTSPNTPLTWTFGTNQNITWVLTGSIANAKLEYSTNNGNNWKIITNSTPAATQSYTWNVPSIFSTSCRIRISDAANPLVYDVSDEVFTIASSIQKTITISSPKSGDIWQAGSTQTIRWTSSNITDLNIYYSLNGGANWNIINTNIPASWGSYAWKNPGIASTNCRIKLAAASDSTISAVSDLFTISESTSSLNLISPNGGEKWQSGSTQTIKWTSSNIENLSISYSTNGGTDWTIITNSTPAAAQSYNWVVPNITSTFSRVRISDVSNSLVYDVSDTLFSIGQFGPKSLRIISPNGGEIWPCQTTQYIEWESTGISRLNIFFTFGDDTSWSLIKSAIPADSGRCSWVVVTGSSNKCKIRIVDAYDASIFAISANEFTVDNIASLFPTFTCTLTNDTQVSDSIYEFDINLLSTGTKAFRLVAIQFDISFNKAILNGGTLNSKEVYNVDGKGDIIPGTESWTTPNLDTYEPMNAFIQPGDIDIISVAVPSRNAATVISTTAPGYCLGRIRLTNSVPFSGASPNLGFKFTGYSTVVLAYLGASGDNSSTNITAYGTYVLNLSNPILSKYALPVELSSFATLVQGRNIVLSWETKTEINFNKFEIERALVSSNDAPLTWISIGIVQASGTSNSPKKYYYTEKELQSGKYKYRLKMIDNDGAFRYSDISISEIAIPKDFELSQNYPNPFNPVTRIEYRIPADSKVILEVYDITGKKTTELVNQDQSAGFYSVDFLSSSAKLSSGVYVYRISAVDKSTGKNFSAVKKMILMK